MPRSPVKRATMQHISPYRRSWLQHILLHSHHQSQAALDKRQVRLQRLGEIKEDFEAYEYLVKTATLDQDHLDQVRIHSLIHIASLTSPPACVQSSSAQEEVSPLLP